MFFPGLQFWIPAVLIFIPLLSCSEKPRPAPPPAPVTVALAAQKAIPVQIQAIGNVEAFKTISVRSQITGRITKVHFEEGRDVGRGDLLLELDRRPWEAALKQAEANLARDTAQMKNAEVEARRYARLIEKGYVSREQHDQKQTAWQALRATVQADKAVVENCRVQLNYCSIHSPLSGRTGALKIDEGNEIKANDMEVAVINQIQPVNIVFSIPEKDLPELKKHMVKGKLSIEAVIPGQAGIERGTLSFIDNTINPATGTIALKGVFANRNKRLWPGQFVNVVMTLTVKNDAVVVPARAVETGQNGKYVFIIKPDLKAELRPVKTGPVFRDEAVVLEGVAPGETVVTEGQLRLMPGTKVAIKQASGVRR
jgi:multidrug efflux system membrane fusion protein